MSTRPLLDGPIHAVPVDESDKLRRENVQLQNVLRDSREEMERMLQTVDAFMMRLRPLHQILAEMFNADPGIMPQSQASSPAPHNQDAWRAWKQQLPGPCAKIIDALLVQPLTQSQLITYCKMHYTTVSKTLGILKRNGLVEHDGKLLRLKRL